MGGGQDTGTLGFARLRQWLHSGVPSAYATPPRRLDCAEVWTGSEKTASLIELPGLTAWVHCVPSGAGRSGGDVHYVSLCPSCTVARIALADVSGHGAAVAALGRELGELMRSHLPALAQRGLMGDLNEAVRAGLDGVHYATMVAVGWHGRRGLLVLTNAGHPPPAWRSAAQGEWSWLQSKETAERIGPAGVPLGLLADVAYDRKVVRPGLGDLVLLYSDGVSESVSPAGEELGRDGLLRLAREIGGRSAEDFGTELAATLCDYRGGLDAADDETIIVLQKVAGP